MSTLVIIIGLVLVACTVWGAFIIWRLWLSIKKQYAEHGDEVPKDIKWTTAGIGFTIVGSPLILLFSLIYLLL